MRKLLITGIFFFLLFAPAQSQEKEDCACRNWIVPRYVSFQYAGGIGNYVIGGGYLLNYKGNLQLLIQYGFTPRFKANKNLHTTALKLIYQAASLDLSKKLKLIPSASIGLSRVFADGPGTFVRLPEYYPEGYYAPNAFRFHLNLGGGLRYNMQENNFIKAIELYAETSTNDLYMTYFFKYKPIGLHHIFSLALGINLYFGVKEK